MTSVVLDQKLTICCLHSVHALLSLGRASRVTFPRWIRWSTALELPNIVIEKATLSNSATLLAPSEPIVGQSLLIQKFWLLVLSHQEPQQAELVAFTKARELANDKIANIYTDVFGVIFDFRAGWQQRGFFTSAGTPIKNGREEGSAASAKGCGIEGEDSLKQSLDRDEGKFSC